MKKALITIFAIIGVITTLLGLVAIGYIFGMKNRTSAPMPTVTVIPTATSTPVPTATQTPSETPTNPSEFIITEEDYFYDENGKLQYTLELIEFVKSFKEFEDLTNPQIITIIESQDFANIVKVSDTFGGLQKYLTKKLEDPTRASWIIRNNLGDITTPSDPSDPAGNTGYGDTSQIQDSNQGGSDENEKTPGDEQQAIDNSDNIEDNNNTDNSDNTEISDNNVNKDESKPQGPSIEVGSEVEYTFTEINKYMYATDAVNLRKGPSTDYEKTGNLNKGDKVWVAGQCNETNWYMIVNGDSIVYVTSKYLSESAPATPTPVPTVTPKQESSSGDASENVKPTETPAKPTEAPSGNVVVDGVEGTYVTALGQQFFIPNGLEESTEPVLIKSVAESIAWSEKYPDGRSQFDIVTVNGEKVQIEYFIPAGVDVSGGITEEALEKLLNSTLW